MKPHLTETQIKKLLKSAILIIDTREQENTHITDWLNENEIGYIERKLDYGDYGMIIPDNDLIGEYELEFTVERKGSLNEFVGNITQGRERFIRELQRTKGKMCLMIENASIDDIIKENYRSKCSYKSVLGSLLTFYARYDIQFTFCEKCNAGQIIYGLLYYKFREELK
jgi:ERCC4-type nuclease